MRIGEVNKDNYKFFLQMLGAKNSKALDAIMGDGKEKGKGKLPTEEDILQNMIKSGQIEEGMFIREGEDTSKYTKTVHVSDEVKNKIIDTVRKQFLRNGNGMSKPGGSDGNEFGAIMKEYRKSIPPSERLSVTWTLSQIQIEEERRLVAYVKKIDPTWDFGKKFDKNILINSNFGTNTVDVKA